MYVGRAEDIDHSDEAYIQMVIDDVPEYITEHKARLEEALEETPDVLVFKTTLNPGEGSTEGNTK